MLSILTLAFWIGGLILMFSSPFGGALIAAFGFVLAGKALRRRDDMETMFGLAFLFIIVIATVRLLVFLAARLS